MHAVARIYPLARLSHPPLPLCHPPLLPESAQGVTLMRHAQAVADGLAVTIYL